MPEGPALGPEGDHRLRSTAAGLDVGLLRPAVALCCAAAFVVLAASARRIEHGEAATSAALARLTGLDGAHRIGSSVVFAMDGRTIGYGITLGCTVALLLLPFFAITAVLTTVRRVSLVRALVALACAAVVVSCVNQVRLLTIVAGIRALGLEAGYSLTHVLVGTTISTIGIVTAASLYLVVLTGGERRG